MRFRTFDFADIYATKIMRQTEQFFWDFWENLLSGDSWASVGMLNHSLQDEERRVFSRIKGKRIRKEIDIKFSLSFFLYIRVWH